MPIVALERRLHAARMQNQTNGGLLGIGFFLQEFDCCGGLSRFLQMTFFTGGEVNEASNDPREWSYVEPDSVDETVLNYVCFGR